MVGSLRVSVAGLRSSVTVAVAAALPVEIRESTEPVPRMMDVGVAGRDRAELVPDNCSGVSPLGAPVVAIVDRAVAAGCERREEAWEEGSRSARAEIDRSARPAGTPGSPMAGPLAAEETVPAAEGALLDAGCPPAEGDDPAGGGSPPTGVSETGSGTFPAVDV